MCGHVGGWPDLRASGVVNHFGASTTEVRIPKPTPGRRTLSAPPSIQRESSRGDRSNSDASPVSTGSGRVRAPELLPKRALLLRSRCTIVARHTEQRRRTLAANLATDSECDGLRSRLDADGGSSHTPRAYHLARRPRRRCEGPARAWHFDPSLGSLRCWTSISISVRILDLTDPAVGMPSHGWQQPQPW